MKKRVLGLQLAILYLFLSMNIVPAEIKAAEQYGTEKITDMITVGESVVNEIEENSQAIYLLDVSKAQKVELSLEVQEVSEDQDDSLEDEDDAWEDEEDDWDEEDDLWEDEEVELEAVNSLAQESPSWKLQRVSKQQATSGTVYESTNTVVQANIEMDEEDTYSYDKTLELENSYYLVVIQNSLSDTSLDIELAVNEEAVHATSISIPQSRTLLKGKSTTLKVSNVRPKGAVTGITWSSSNSSVAKVNPKTGKVTARKYGQAYIKATLQNGKEYKCKILVEQPNLNINAVTLLKGNKVKLKVLKNFSKVTYASANRRVAVVTSHGIVKARAKGTTRIIAKVGTKRLYCRVKVEEPKLSASNVDLSAGRSKSLSVSGTTKKVAWSSSNPYVATVNSRGKVTTKNVGRATISAKVGGQTLLRCSVVVKAIQKKVASKHTGTQIVYVTESGGKYHCGGCRYLWHSKIPMSLEDAVAEGYEPCSVCH